MNDPSFQRRQATRGLEQLAHLVRAQSWRQDGTPSLPPTQSAVLSMLEGTADGMRARQIAARLGVSPASLSESLKAMEGKRWIRRTPDPVDARAARVRLTAAGSRMAVQLQRPDRGMGPLVEALGEADLGALLRVTQLLVNEAQEQGLATGLRTCLGCEFFRPFASGRRDAPHVCAFVDKPFGDAELRVDCAEQRPADDDIRRGSVLRFRQQTPP
ncbi:MarR family winged helix-turn-helix transcriptional regulator [Pseudoxanthomonas sp. F37]|uniref:MarR family winged helix-turn-helix transcriptional regulator n=1 Tax=Pseudoxanthomonas TaxID=83618 RepID=UPI001FD473C2|nr:MULTISPECIES: MarR family winged helix-turn-helix transcriptional regulator [Pseudoxanthomonas]UOV06193.1 MarR family winged helix-turn-helix transcriptional regulator [Pseudoxanthomonas mexicana]UOV07775.1 MarR family winged helix-turn-helix transcriptional regulator [Pseudoxanthomonas sp. F37]